MNWMTVALNALRWRLLLLGAMAGIWAGVLHESVRWLPWLADRPLLQALAAGVGLGAGLGCWLAPADALLQRYYRRAVYLGIAGAFLGGAAGLAAVGVEWLVEQMWPVAADRADWLRALRGGAGFLATLGLVGAVVGLSTGIYPMRAGRMWRGGLLGLTAGALLGPAVVLLADLAALDAWVALLLLAVWGALLALVVHWWNRRRARRWLRLLNGRNVDSIFPLRGRRLWLGKSERNDVPLTDFQEVYPFHCELRWAGDHYDIVDHEQGGVVLVNYRQVQDYSLRPGDLIKVGTALLQYGEPA